MFLSYRVEDTRDVALELFERLERKLGKGRVFIDRKGLVPGRPWPDSLREQVEGARVFLALIGPGWLGARDKESEQRRLDMKHDWVREEIARGLARAQGKQIPFAPVLVNGAGMPIAEHLPDEIGLLPKFQALTLREEHFEEDVTLLVAWLEENLRAPEIPPPPQGDPIARYRSWALERHRNFDLQALGSGRIQLPLEEVYVPLRLAGAREELGDPRAHRVPPSDDELTVERIFSACPAGRPHAVVYGEPGSGKTTALRKLLMQGLRAPGSPHAIEGLDSDVLPVFVPLRRFDHGALSRDLEDNLGALLAHESDKELDPAVGPALWRRGRLLLLLDGLDEVGDKDLRRDLCDYVGVQIARRADVRAVVSCRTAFRAQVDLGDSFTSLDVRPLVAEQCRTLVRRWFAAAARQTDLTRSQAQERATRLVDALDGTDYAAQRLGVLVGTPLLLTLLCVVVLNDGEMPRHRVSFYSKCLQALLQRWRFSQHKTDPMLDLDTALEILRALAWKLHTARRRDNLRQLEFAQIARPILKARGKKLGPIAVFEWLRQEAGVLVKYAPEAYGFLHLGVQEFLCADAVRSDTGLDALVDAVADDWWREVTLLHVGLRERQTFGPWCDRLLGRDGWTAHEGMLVDALADAHQPDLTPLLGVLEGGYSTVEQCVVLRLLQHRAEESVVAAAGALVDADDNRVKGLARAIVDRAAARKWAGDREVLVHAGDRELGADVTTALRGAGYAARQAMIAADFDRTLESRAVIVLSSAGFHPWDEPDIPTALDMLQEEATRLLICHVGAGADAVPVSLQAVQLLREEDATSAAAAIAAALAARAPLEPVRTDVPGVQTGKGVVRPGAAPNRGDVWVEPATAMRFVGVPGGTFEMGAGVHSDAHMVTVSSFWLGETPVTNAVYGQFLAAQPHEEPAHWRDRRFSGPDQPVVGVNIEDAEEFCAWLSSLTGAKIGLPTEAQWEYAARDTDARTYPWGYEEPDESRADFGQDWGDGKPRAVGSSPAGRGPFGALDQAGCVWEWCADEWDEDAYAKRVRADVRDPLVRLEGVNERCLRGGAWDAPPESLRSGVRYRYGAWDRYHGIGFRVALSPAST